MNDLTTEDANKATQRCSDIAFVCESCKSLLGFVDPAKEKLRVKYRDLYIRITNADLVEITCRSCGQMNSLNSDGSHA